MCTKTQFSFELPDFNIAHATRVTSSMANEIDVKKMREFVAAAVLRDGTVNYRLIPRSLIAEWILFMESSKDKSAFVKCIEQLDYVT